MDAKDLKKYLAGLGIAGLVAGTSLMAAETPAAGGKTEGTLKSAPTESALKTAPSKTAPAKSG
jgi:radical SAM modification target selenobiotic family peptide